MVTASAVSPPLTEELVEYMATGVDMIVATRDAALAPESMLGMGIKVHPDRCTVTAYLPTERAAATLRNLQDNGQIAITLVHASTGKGIQLKGSVVSLRESDSSDRDLQAVFRSALVEELAAVGVPRSATRRLHWWPSTAVDVAVDSVFVQTPGPKAGEPFKKA
ncbi:MAG TPA: pyridoxamine 5'-phosphate oxidase family protein [Polyangiaceae bacterium]|nr:pyridoxamine 5'-phosphate oxidase family protein [Polyangiaceae bacterium]